VGTIDFKGARLAKAFDRIGLALDDTEISCNLRHDSHPTPRPPFVLDCNHTLLQAIYRDCWFEGHLSQLGGTFEETIKTFEGRLAQVHAAIGFMRWLPGLGAKIMLSGGIANGLSFEARKRFLIDIVFLNR
jgi:hypothetical protein